MASRLVKNLSLEGSDPTQYIYFCAFAHAALHPLFLATFVLPRAYAAACILHVQRLLQNAAKQTYLLHRVFQA